VEIKTLNIGKLQAKIPIIQGGMGVGVSLSGLAAAVANEGGIGIISAAQVGYREPDFINNAKEANIRALRAELRKARQLSPEGIIGVNVMVATNNYDDLVKVAVEEKADVIISGAGLPSHLPKLVEGSETKIAPIVSSGKAAKIITKVWKDKYSYLPDFIVIEGPEAGGHLGFKMDELQEHTNDDLETIFKDVKEELKAFQEDGVEIPIIVAGGIYTGQDIAKFLKLGASGVQMATRFICTEECDADIEYKNAYIKCSKEDIQLIKSPVGLPGRAIRNEFIDIVSKDKIKVTKCFSCLKKCNPADTIYCISKALIESVQGNVTGGLLFTGSNGYRMDKIVTVKELINELTLELEAVN